MDLTKFYPENLSKLNAEDLKEFKALTIEQIEELSKQETSFKPILVYKNHSSKHNSFPTSGNYTSVLKFLKEDNKIELISPRVMFTPNNKSITTKAVTPIEVVEVEAMSLKDFAEKKEVEPTIELEVVPGFEGLGEPNEAEKLDMQQPKKKGRKSNK